MTNTDVFVKSQQAYLHQIRETWSHASQQLPMLKELGKHHGETIRRNQTEAGRARAEALQELLPQLATPKAALAYHVGDELTIKVTVLDKLADGVVALDTLVTGRGGDHIAEGVAEVLAPTARSVSTTIAFQNCWCSGTVISTGYSRPARASNRSVPLWWCRKTRSRSAAPCWPRNTASSNRS